MAEFRDLVTILYRPGGTMRHVLDSKDRWAPQVVALAFVLASVNNSEVAEMPDVLPGLNLGPAVALVALSLIIGAALWVITLYLLSWIAWFAGRKMGGQAPLADVRAALAWGMVPVIWSILYRLPLGIIHQRLHVAPAVDMTAVLIDFASKGGCSLVVVYLTFQLVFAIWSIWVASNTLAEAQHFATAKGFANVAITLAVPAAITIAAIAARHG